MKLKSIVFLAIGACVLVSSGLSAETSIVNTTHNLSASGPGDVRAMSEDRICIFCHTPHHAEPKTPLWNRSIKEGSTYETYESTTIGVSVPQPTGPSRLCLSCHDGTVGLGSVLSRPGGIEMRMELGGRPSDLGEDLKNDHPFSFSYGEAQPYNNELMPNPPTDLTLYMGDFIHCSTCHDPHDDSFGMFLRVDNKFSALCEKCHIVAGWPTSSHTVSALTWSGTGEDPWPLNERLAEQHKRTTVAENGCENCHTPHNAGGNQRLMNYLSEEQNCIFACHNGNLPDSQKNIKIQFDKFYLHPVAQTKIDDLSGNFHDPEEDILTYPNRHVECNDCHDPHSVNAIGASAPQVSGRLINVTGIDIDGFLKNPAQYEYEICFKCHGNLSEITPRVTRHVDQNNTRLEFAPENPSFHPVAAIGKNANVPSLPIHVPGSISLDATMSESSYIYCSDCHSSDGTSKVGGTGPNGPHGSVYEGILRERYDMAYGIMESYSAYALCYRCHDRDVVLSDFSFKKNSTSNKGGHSGHMAAGGGTPCSACHDPHGLQLDPLTGDHEHLINFDAAEVDPYTGSYPFFTDGGLVEFTGSCTLICHGVIHDGSATYSYP